MGCLPRGKRNTYRLKNGKRFAAVVLIFIVAVMFLSMLARTGVNAHDGKEPIRVVVQPGDTLWGIAAKFNQDDRADIRRFIYRIKKANGLQASMLVPGQVLLIPEQ